MKHPPTMDDLKQLAHLMNMRPKEFIRENESEYKTLDLQNKLEDDETLFDAMTKHPRLIQRPIVIIENKAFICRPGEKVLTLL